MTRYMNRLPRTFAEAEQMINGPSIRYRHVPGVQNTSIWREENGDIRITYYTTEIARFSPNGGKTFNTGGYSTRSTLDRINAMVPRQYKFRIRGGSVEVTSTFQDVPTIHGDGISVDEAGMPTVVHA